MLPGCGAGRRRFKLPNPDADFMVGSSSVQQTWSQHQGFICLQLSLHSIGSSPLGVEVPRT